MAKMQDQFGVSTFVLILALGLAACSPVADEGTDVTDAVGGLEGQSAVVFDVPTCATVSAGAVERTEYSAHGGGATFEEPLAIETVGTVHRLPETYPDDWLIIHDANFDSMIDGRFIIFDPAAEHHGFKSSIHAGKLGGVDVAPERNEIYVATTYYSRGISGIRTDIISVHDMCTLEKKAELEIPSGLSETTPFKNKFRLSNDDRFGFAYNFTPASSVTVVNVDQLSVLNQVDIPGCSLAYPMGARSFASVCGDGTMLGSQLDENGNVLSQTRTDSVIDFDANAMFMKPARFNDEIYFPTFRGDLHGFDLSGEQPTHLGTWSLISDEDRESGWRPGGWTLIAADPVDGELYVLMHPDGQEGTHKNPGTEIWVFDIETKERKRRMPLELPAISIVATQQFIVATNVNMELDVYDAASGALSRAIGQTAMTPFVVYTAAGQ